MDNIVWAVEYSKSQGFFQFGTLGEVIESNRQALACGFQREYVLIHLGRSFAECAEFAEKWRAAGYCPNFHRLNDVPLVRDSVGMLFTPGKGGHQWMTEKICPLCFAAEGDTVIECQPDRCAWSYDGGCSLVTIAQSLDGLNDHGIITWPETEGQ